jgi:hypothetical protein
VERIDVLSGQRDRIAELAREVHRARPLADTTMSRIASVYTERIAPHVHQRW